MSRKFEIFVTALLILCSQNAGAQQRRQQGTPLSWNFNQQDSSSERQGGPGGFDGQGGPGMGGNQSPLVRSAMSSCATTLGITLPSQMTGSSSSSSSSSSGTTTDASAVTPAQWQALSQCVQAATSAGRACLATLQQARTSLDTCLRSWGQFASSATASSPTDSCTTGLSTFTAAAQTAQTCIQQAQTNAVSSSSSSSSSSGS